jgi:hypothetical protein
MSASVPETYLRTFINDLGFGGGNNQVDLITATASQTIFNLSHTPLFTPSVYVNNKLKYYNTHYTYSGTTVTMLTGLTVGDVFKAVYTY